jgi:hypothetical protein
VSALRPIVATRARIAMSAGIVLCLAALAWYLGSPFLIRSTLDEDLPLTYPAAAPVASISVSRGTPALPPAVAGTPLPAGPPETLEAGRLGYVDAIHNGTGDVRLLRATEGIVLRFSNVAITNAPDVHVYLSRESGGKWAEATSLYVGPLKATNGSFNYPIPADADLSLYKSVVVWCRQFSVLITWADLRG